MALLPDEIIVKEEGRKVRHYRLEITKFEPWQWGVDYVFGFYPDEEVKHSSSSMDSPTDAFVETLVWVLQNHLEDKETIDDIIKNE